jgi:hypothetical protein
MTAIAGIASNAIARTPKDNDRGGPAPVFGVVGVVGAPDVAPDVSGGLAASCSGAS